ncbi:MAG TPA: hypothetical protein VFC10_18470 [Terriglobia bacterium]|jgi:hypothetical protein|nr:hypothetical protein [Terriglobia bacterium]
MTDTELISRLEKLERDNRRLKGFAFAVLVLSTALATMYATSPIPQRIKAHEFDLVDNSGNIRGSMLFFMGNAAISLLDAQGKRRAAMTVDTSGAPGIGVFDAQGILRAGMSVDTSGGTGIGVFDAQGILRAAMMVHTSGEPGIGLFGEQGKGAIAMRVTPSGEPSINLFDKEGFRMSLGNIGTVIPATGEAHETSAASITMFGNDKKHHVIWRAP